MQYQLKDGTGDPDFVRAANVPPHGGVQAVGAVASQASCNNASTIVGSRLGAAQPHDQAGIVQELPLGGPLVAKALQLGVEAPAEHLEAIGLRATNALADLSAGVLILLDGHVYGGTVVVDDRRVPLRPV